MEFADRILGEVPDSLPDYTQVCPKCRAVLSYEDEGYGFAFGGGLGQYMSCPNDECDWFVKWLDQEEETK